MDLFVDETTKFITVFIDKYRNLEANTNESFDNTYKTQYLTSIRSKQQKSNP